MTKNDIKNGMYLKLRNDELRLVVGNKFIGADGKWNDVAYYNDDLENTADSEWDIMEVFVSSSPILFKEESFERIWVREVKREVKVGDIYRKTYCNSDKNEIFLIYRIDDDEVSFLNVWDNDEMLDNNHISIFQDEEDFEFIGNSTVYSSLLSRIIEVMRNKL